MLRVPNTNDNLPPGAEIYVETMDIYRRLSIARTADNIDDNLSYKNPLLLPVIPVQAVKVVNK